MRKALTTIYADILPFLSRIIRGSLKNTICEDNVMYILGFDIGGTKSAVVAADWDGTSIDIKGKISMKTDLSVSPHTMIDRLISASHEILECTPDSIGISCGGPLDSKKGVILGPPNLPGWDEVYIVRYIEDKFGVPVRLQNDANACALAEWRFGAGKGTENMVFLTFGTGLGAGLILGGRLYEGTNGNAGEIGHLRLAPTGPTGYGKEGSFEGFCSGGGIAQLGKILADEKIKSGVTPLYMKDGAEISAKTIAEAAEMGDETALEVYELSGSYLGKGLSLVIDILNPEKIVIGSIFTRSRKLLMKSMEREIKKEALPFSAEVCSIVPAALGENIGDYGALATATL